MDSPTISSLDFNQITGIFLTIELGVGVSLEQQGECPVNTETTQSELIEILTVAQDLVNPIIAGHGKRVAFRAALIAEALGYDPQRISTLKIAARLHDIGAFSLSIKEKNDLNQFDVMAPEKHCAVGFTLLKQYGPFSDIADMVLHHHTFWNYGKRLYFNDVLIPQESYIIHLADRIDVFLKENDAPLACKDNIIGVIFKATGAVFPEDVSAAFQKVSQIDAFWLQGQHINASVTHFRGDDQILSDEELLDFVKILSLTIDYKSPFTSTHSSGVARTAVELGKLAGSDDEMLLLLCGYLHDLGKLLVPNEILDKQNALTPEDRIVINSHPYYTYQVLSQSKQLLRIAEIAANHHEKLDGSGYPSNVKASELDLNSRVIAVADIFTALTENRPYRDSLNMESVLSIMSKMSYENHIDETLLTLITDNYDYFNAMREAEQTYSRAYYKTFWQETEETIYRLSASKRPDVDPSALPLPRNH